MWKLTLNKRFTPSATSATFRVLNSHTRLTTTAWTAHATRQVTPDRARLEPGDPAWVDTLHRQPCDRLGDTWFLRDSVRGCLQREAGLGLSFRCTF